ncbi:MAG: TonB-dependent receptor [Halofilum sp. (in: g-proteobacteria)]|nr:TonB-dependent receptor [Halofilum sp. (in: g-proteobacteria)]
MQNRTPLRRALAVALAGTIPSVPAFADDSAGVSPVVVTATRTAQTADQSLSSVSVISREDIERTQATSLPELLGRVQGVDFTQNGGRGKASSLFIRGTNSDQIIVLIDGVRVGSATLGTTSFEGLPLDNVERIEVVRGPRSSLYGADAIGGVIQIFTRASEGPRASIGFGSNEYGRFSAGYGRQGDRSGFSIDVSAEDTEGFDARENDCLFCADEPDDDGFESANVSLRGRHEITNDVELSGSLLVADTENEFDGSFQNSGEQRQTVATGKIDWRVTDRWDSKLSIGRSTDDTDNFLDGDDASFFETERTDIRWQNDITVGDAQLVTMGVDVLRDEIDSSNDFDVEERETTGVFVQHQWTGLNWNTQVNVRRESFDDGFDNPNSGDEFDDQTTGSIAAGYRIGQGLRAFGSYGTAFKAPSFNQLFFPGFGNPDLDPEESKTYELGLRGRAGAVNWEVTAYRTVIDDLIAFNVATFAPENIDEATIQGIEVGFDANWRDWQVSANADFKDPEDSAGGTPGNEGNQLPRRAERGYNASVTHLDGAWTYGVDIAHEGPRFDDVGNFTPLASYTLVDLRASWAFAPDWRARFKVENAGDVDHTIVNTYKTGGRLFLFQLDWQPGA